MGGICWDYYGTPVKYVDDAIENGRNVILDIEVQVRAMWWGNARMPFVFLLRRLPGRSWNAA